MSLDTFPHTGFVTAAQLLRPDGPVPCSLATLLKWVAADRFPKPVNLGLTNRLRVWDAAKVREWFAAQ